MTKKHGKERAYLVCLSILFFIIERSHDRNSNRADLEAGADAKARKDFCLMDSSLWLTQPDVL